MRINGVVIDNTFAEAFPMRATRLLITAMSPAWAMHAARALTGFASSVIACGCEAGIERKLAPSETPDGRPGVSVLIFAMSKKQLAEQLRLRVGQSVMTTATSACFSGIASDTMLPLGRPLRYFGDGHQISKIINGTRFWRIPVMHGEFLCEESTGVVPAIGGGNFLVMSATVRQGLAACERAVEAISRIRGVVTTFPGGVVGSGSKVGSKYKFMIASTNEAFCPTLKGQVNTELGSDVGSVLEIVIDGLDEPAVSEAIRVGIRAACRLGARRGIQRISAGNYGGKLGPHHFHLREILR